MNKLIILSLLLLQAGICYCQTIPHPKKQLSAADYRTKSSDAAILGSLLLAGGTTLFLVGRNTQEHAEFLDFSGAAVEGLGIIAALGSIPLFVSSAHYHHRVKALALGIKPETARSLQQQSYTKSVFPALSLKINF